MEAGAEMIARARLICGESHVVTHPAVLAAFRSDGLKRDGPLPLAAVLPGSAAEVSHLVAACAATGIPYRVRGAGTSSTGDALPLADGVMVVLTRMRRILRASGAELTVEPGTPVSPLLPGGIDRWFAGAEPLGTVGGYVAQTSGLTNVSALELVRTGGELVRLDARQPGYDLTGAFPGSRGRAGIAVALTLRAIGRP